MPFETPTVMTLCEQSSFAVIFSGSRLPVGLCYIAFLFVRALFVRALGFAS